VTIGVQRLPDVTAWLRWALLAMLALTLAACTTTPKPIEGASPDAFSRIGRFAITVNEESGKQSAVQGGFSWSDDGRRYVLDLTNPLGSTEARVEGQPGAASLTKADGTRLVADNPDALAEDALGSSVPVSGLRDWLRGKLPAQPEASDVSRDELGRPASFEQGGWRAKLSRYDTLGPQLLVLERLEPGRRVTVRLVVNQP
jgi:outer membrane lipoprotein LolB